MSSTWMVLERRAYVYRTAYTVFTCIYTFSLQQLSQHSHNPTHIQCVGARSLRRAVNQASLLASLRRLASASLYATAT